MPKTGLHSITALILSGGAGVRMQGADKGWLEVDGQPLIKRAITSMQTQAGRILISANRFLAEYRALGYPVLEDAADGFGGPIMGMRAGLEALQTDYLLCVPVDAAKLPLDLAQRLHGCLLEENAPAAVVHNGEQIQPLCCLLQADTLPSLRQAMEGGLTSPKSWLHQIGAAPVDYSQWPPCYWSINTSQELERVSARLGAEAA